jgi:DNA-binding XRE family transcriptional regulator
MPCMTGHDTTDPAGTISHVIGRRVRASRTELSWTLDQLAQRSGVSRRMLINVEQGATNPSIATLLRLSDALGIGLPALVATADGRADTVVVHRSGQVSPMWSSDAGGYAVMVAGTSPPDVNELWDWCLGPGDAYRSEAHRAGTWELLHILSGTVVLMVGGAEHKLKKGDSASFDGTSAHAYVNGSGSRSARFSLAVYEPALTRESS